MIQKTSSVKQCVILSGKGGTGKTSVTASLAHFSSQTISSVFVDADVDAANLALVTGVDQLDHHPFSSSKVAIIDPGLCNSCGKCFEVCRFDAIRRPSRKIGPFLVKKMLCEECAACVHACPQSAIHLEIQQDGEWYHSLTPYGHMFHAELYPGAENSGKLVTQIKEYARQYAEDHGISLILIDGPPGIGCPVIAASTGADLAVLVAEPGVSGIHDLDRIIQTLEHFDIPILIAINKATLFPEGSRNIRELADTSGYEICGEIPFDDRIPQAMLHAQPISEFAPDCPATAEISRIWRKIRSKLLGYLA